MKAKNPNRHKLRTGLVTGGFMIWLLLIGVRAGYLQLYRGTWLSQKAAGQYEKEQIVLGKRGSIYDAHHEAMAVSIETTSLAANPAMIENREKAAAALAKALHLKLRDVKRKLSGARSFVWLKRQATPKEVAAVKKLGFKGVDFLPEHTRFYPNTTLAGQVLGFTGIDGHGLEGLEFYYDNELKGVAQTVTVLKDALGRGFDMDHQVGSDQAGNNLVLTIDRHIQYITEQALADAVTAHQAHSGMAIVMDPKTGAILALANYPLFNPNNFRRYDRAVWRNRAITDPFEPGSTMKIFNAAAALESGNSTPSTIFYCENGSYLIGSHTVNDTKPHGWLSLQQIVKYSSNIGAVKVAQHTGSRVFYQALRGFGFGDRTHVDCPGESSGSLANYKRWTAMDNAAIAFGQGISVTALQLITAAAAIANDGLLMQPHIVQAITDANGRLVRTVEPTALRQVISAENALTIRRIMRTVITSGGTGVEAELEGYSVAGKTGTAQKIDKNGTYAQNRYIASFVGFAPSEQPVLAVLVVVNEPQDTYYGGPVAAPAFRQIVKETFGYLNVAPAIDMRKLRVSRDYKVSG